MKRILIAAAIALSIAVSGASRAQESYPTRIVRLVVGYAAGGSTDVVARTLAAALSKKWGIQVIVENKAGADSIIASEGVAKAAPDGYTLLLANSANATHPSTQAKLSYNPLKDLAPVIMAASAKNVVTTASPNIQTLQDALRLARANPKTVTYGSGSPLHHLVGELLSQQAGVKLMHVPYKGAGPAITDAIAGHVVLNIGTVASQEPYIRSGKLRALAVAADTRSSVLPDIPTMAEVGVPNVRADYWIGIMGPSGVPASVIAKLNSDINAILKESEVSQRFSALGLEPLGGSAEDMGKLLAAEVERWSRVATQAGIEKQ